MQSKLSRRIQWLVFAAALMLSAGADAQSLQIVALGDSNTAGYGVGRRNAFPALMEAQLRSAGYDVDVSNRGISGDTTGGMLSRLDKAVPRGTRIAIVQGGYNDRRRGVPAQTTDENVDAILARLSARKVRVVLCGFSGAQWAGIARRHRAVLVPGSTCYDASNRGFDGLHMNRAGHRVVAARLAPVIQRLLGRR
ncbi:MAG TPA: GDSL-type esterase/lipase family protein [Mesorhizobium sp.]|jgi:acyl-CoA thioesterase-1|nr:GDSL-type esterase/lipase family protein [Mesorhizobium sp.]